LHSKFCVLNQVAVFNRQVFAIKTTVYTISEHVMDFARKWKSTGSQWGTMHPQSCTTWS